MSNDAIANWISAVVGFLSLILAIISLVKARRAEAKTTFLENQFKAVVQLAIHRPIMSGGGGGGGGGAGPGGVGGAGGGVAYDASQSAGQP